MDTSSEPAAAPGPSLKLAGKKPIMKHLYVYMYSYILIYLRQCGNIFVDV